MVQLPLQDHNFFGKENELFKGYYSILFELFAFCVSVPLRLPDGQFSKRLRTKKRLVKIISA